MRTSTAACFAFALCSIVGCKKPKGVDVDPFELVPTAVDAVFGFDLDALAASPVGTALNGAAQSDVDIAALQRGISKCNEKLDGFKGVFGFNTQSEAAFAVMQLQGIGDEDIVRCIEKEIEPDAFSIIVFETRGDVRITPQEGGGHLVILNKNTLVLADAVFDAEIFERIEKSDARTLSPVVKAAKKVSDQDIWISYAPSDSDRADLADIEGGSGLQIVSVAVELDKGIALHASLEFSGDEDAKAMRTFVPEAMAEAKSELPALGIPNSVVESLKVEGEGTEVTISLDADEGAMTSIITAAMMMDAE